MTLGLLVQLGTLFLVPRELELVRQGIGFVAGALLVFGGAKTAASKGFSPWFGLFGLLSFVGMGIILLLPHRDSFRRARAAAPEASASTEPATSTEPGADEDRA